MENIGKVAPWESLETRSADSIENQNLKTAKISRLFGKMSSKCLCDTKKGSNYQIKTRNSVQEKVQSVFRGIWRGKTSSKVLPGLQNSIEEIHSTTSKDSFSEDSNVSKSSLIRSDSKVCQSLSFSIQDEQLYQRLENIQISLESIPIKNITKDVVFRKVSGVMDQLYNLKTKIASDSAELALLGSINIDLKEILRRVVMISPSAIAKEIEDDMTEIENNGEKLEILEERKLEVEREVKELNQELEFIEEKIQHSDSDAEIEMFNLEVIFFKTALDYYSRELEQIHVIASWLERNGI